MLKRIRGVNMKRVLLLLMVLIIGLTACSPEENIDDNQNPSGSYYVLPDLNGYTVAEIEELLTDRNQSYEIVYETVESEEYELQFIMYTNYDTGDIVSSTDTVIIKAYPAFTGDRTFLVLPDLSGYTSTEIADYFLDLDIEITITESIEYDEELEDTFYGYGGNKAIGDRFYFTSRLSVVVYKIQDDLSGFYFPIDMEYDGPLLSEDFDDIDPVDPRGGYFEVTLNYCTDGDTAVFHYPEEIYNLITSYAKSTRFLNMDTEETYSGGEEEWGKPASVYTCELLTSAESIVLQTDPGDALTGNYGRLLAWVWVKLPGETDYHLLNYMVVKQGLAQVKYLFGAGETISYGEYTYTEWMHSAQAYAEANELGQWGDLLDYYWDYDNDEPDYHKWHSN